MRSSPGSWTLLRMPNRGRVLRGRETERLLAEYLRPSWPGAVATAASLRGDDVLNVGDLAIEVKATAGSPILSALAQVHARAAEGQIPVGVWRPSGFGEARIDQWVVFMRVGTFFGPLAERANHFLSRT